MMKISALLTGRGNNTLKDKNVLEVLGQPVLYYIANAARQCPEITDWYCSSDDEKILAAAEKLGYKRILRPPELARPTSQHIDTIKHALNSMEKRNALPDICVVLLANNITAKTQWITDCIKIMKNDFSVTAVVPVYVDNDHHPLRAKSLNDDGTLSMYEKNITGKISTNRQDLPKCYFLAHNFWVLNVHNLLYGDSGQQPWEFMGDKIAPYEIEESIDIHRETDLIIACEWLRSHYPPPPPPSETSLLVLVCFSKAKTIRTR
jgi:CMP-N-acetylneuraminic acid synthetase